MPNLDGHHNHEFAGVDIDLTQDIPADSLQYKSVEKLLQSSVELKFGGSIVEDSIKIEGGVLNIPVTVKSLTGHSLPSGTSFSREAWLELLVINSKNDTIYQKGLIVNSSDQLDYNDESLMLYTTILYDQNNHEGNIIHEASNALSYDDRTLRTLFYDTKTYSIYLEEQTNQELFIKTAKETCQTRISNIVVDLVKFAETEADVVSWGRGEGHGTMTFKCKSIDYGILSLFHLTSNGQIKFPLNSLKSKIIKKEIVRDYQLKLESNFMMYFDEDEQPSDIFFNVDELFLMKTEIDKFIFTIQGITARLHQ